MYQSKDGITSCSISYPTTREYCTNITPHTYESMALSHKAWIKHVLLSTTNVVLTQDWGTFQGTSKDCICHKISEKHRVPTGTKQLIWSSSQRGNGSWSNGSLTLVGNPYLSWYIHPTQSISQQQNAVKCEREGTHFPSCFTGFPGLPGLATSEAHNRWSFSYTLFLDSLANHKT